MIATNLEKFKREKAEKSNNNRCKSKRINLSELRPSRNEWNDVYETIVTESLLSQSDKGESTDSSTAFTNFVKSNTALELRTAFEKVVGDGDHETPEATFTSLHDLMTKPPSFKADENDLF